MIVGSGTVALDTVETLAGSVREAPGGSALYFAAAACRWVPVGVVGVTGEDFPQEPLSRLVVRGVDLTGLGRFPHPTFRWHARYDGEGRRDILSVHRGGIVTERPTVPGVYRDPDLLFLGSADPTMQLSVLAEAGRPAIVMLDTMAHWIRDRAEELKALLARTHVLLVNEEEAMLLGGSDDPARAAASLLERGPTWVVVKRGALGASAYAADADVTVPATPLSRPVDPTGAGDAFAGGLAPVLVREGLGEEAMRSALLQAATMGARAVSAFSFDGLLDD